MPRPNHVVPEETIRPDPTTTRRALLTSVAAAVASLHAGTAAQASETVQTVTGPIKASELGTTLMHEHIVADQRAPADRRPGDYKREEAVDVALPHLKALHEAGCQTMVEITPIHIGRDPLALKSLSQLSGLNIVAATGIFGGLGQTFIPTYAREEGAEQLAARYIREAHEGMDSTGILPGIIKTGVNREAPLPAIEKKLVRAALRAHKETGLTVASHTFTAAAVLEQLRMVESEGVAPHSFIWVHAYVEKDHAVHIKVAKEGAWVEFDDVSFETDDWHLECVTTMAEAGLLHRTLISQDRELYNVGESSHSNFGGYTLIFTKFLPRLRAAGFTSDEITQLLVTNPARALTGSGS